MLKMEDQLRLEECELAERFALRMWKERSRPHLAAPILRRILEVRSEIFRGSYLEEYWVGHSFTNLGLCLLSIGTANAITTLLIALTIAECGVLKYRSTQEATALAEIRSEILKLVPASATN